MSQLYPYTITLYLQGEEDNILYVSADSQQEADQIVLTAIKENSISTLIDDCTSSETDLDYGTVEYLTPQQAKGRETINVSRNKQCIFSNKPDKQEEDIDNSTFNEKLDALKYEERLLVVDALNRFGGSYTWGEDEDKPVIAVSIDSFEPAPCDMVIEEAIVNSEKYIFLKGEDNQNGNQLECYSADVFCGHLIFIIDYLPNNKH